MPEVKVTHKNLKGDDAKVAPKRTPVPPGLYHALIMSASLRMTKGTPPMQKISVEFQLLFGVDEEKGDDHNETHQGRRVYQDYILENDEGRPDLSAQRRYELRQLLDATEVPFTDEGFNTDHLINKYVKITVRHRKGDQRDEEGNYYIYTNVVKVDTAEAVDESDLV